MFDLHSWNVKAASWDSPVLSVITRVCHTSCFVVLRSLRHVLSDCPCSIASVLPLGCFSSASKHWTIPGLLQVCDYPSFQAKTSLAGHMERVVSCKFDLSGRHE